MSVIVPVRNGADDLRGLLAALDAQTLPAEAWEVVIGDDGSTEDLRAAVGERPHVRIAAGPPLNAYAARNRAVAASNGEALAFVDADCRPAPDWLERGLAALESADAVGGRIDWRIDGARTVWSLLDIDTFVDQRHAIAEGTALTGNLFVSRAMFDRAGGFDDSLPSHGDYAFAQRCVELGGRLAFADDAIVTHPTYTRGRPFLRKVIEANTTYAIREGREGRIPSGVGLREWVPVVQTVRSRRRYGRSLLLNRRRLADSNLSASAADDLKTLPYIYVVLPYLRSGAQLAGYLKGRRSVRS